jgi:nucleoside-diphosphate-sugar epimerase
VIEPAVKGTTSILRSAAKVGSVKRVVITSSIATLIPPEYLVSRDTKRVFSGESLPCEPIAVFEYVLC